MDIEQNINYVPTLGEYAEVIAWLTDNPGRAVPVPMIRAYTDALQRADLKRVAEIMSQQLDARNGQ